MNTLSIQRPLPSMLIATPAAFSRSSHSSLVNRALVGVEVLKISGGPNFASASSSATQNSAVSVLESRKASTAREFEERHQVHKPVRRLACPHCNPSKGAGTYPKTPPPGYTGPWPPPWWTP